MYDVDKLRDWKKEFGFNDVISNLSSRIVGADLGNLELLSPEAEDHLRKLAESKVADLDFSRYTDVFDAQVLIHLLGLGFLFVYLHIYYSS